MNSKVDIISNDNSELKFVLSNTNVSIANSIRRTILSDIPVIVFNTSLNSDASNRSVVNIIENTSMFNNEIIKQRLGCIPIHITNYNEYPYKNYLLEINVENTSESPIYVTTGDFKIKDTINDVYIKESDLKNIFPINAITGDYIEFLRLKPKISSELKGEKIHLTSEFAISTAKEDGMFNAVSNCTYMCTIDQVAQKTALNKQKQVWKDEGKSSADIEFESTNWKLLDGQRIIKRDSFDFTIESVGVYNNMEIVNIACEILKKKLDMIEKLLDTDSLDIKTSETTIKNCFDIILENEDYTIGKLLEFYLYNKFYNGGILTYCGFKKMHPHDTFSIIRLGYKELVTVSTIKNHIKECIADAKLNYTKIMKSFPKE